MKITPVTFHKRELSICTSFSSGLCMYSVYMHVETFTGFILITTIAKFVVKSDVFKISVIVLMIIELCLYTTKLLQTDPTYIFINNEICNIP